ncbi:ABC transporter permease [Arthrobacter oryzae]|uniref:ABC transporter permease n=1 Tax=Arthrobacter oryzae TaxID=409290 RepID=UPI002861136A|nr:ABC transporter permease [Arthrobacter oryzae]MDR6507715.1 NitT/TauT family transport system permease protein [Arthrobacter oryzae]
MLLLVFLAAWQFLPGLLKTPSFVIPPLTDVIKALTDPVSFPLYMSNAGTTLSEVLTGLVIGIVIGLFGAIVLAQFPSAYAVVFPYIVAIESIPKVALAPLFVIWFGFGMPSKVVVVVLLAFFPVLVNTIHGIRGVDRDQIGLFEANGASRSQIRMKLLIPAALPSIFSGLELAVANSMIGAIVAEFVGAQHGLGVMILQAQARLETAAVFALLIILSALGIVLNLIVRIARRKIIFWSPDSK